MFVCEGDIDDKSIVNRMNFNAIVWIGHIIIIRNFYCYCITKSATLDNMDGSDAILCWQSTNHHVRLLLVCIYCVSMVLLLLSW